MIASPCWAFLALAATIPALSFAQENCPWLNTPTAEGILGGAVSENIDNAACTFTRKEGADVYQLSIQVRRISDPGKTLSRYASHCRPRIPLKGIGNEAFACEAKRGRKLRTDEIVGRVRDRVFVIEAIASDPSIGPEALKKAARMAAEQVSGNLF